MSYKWNLNEFKARSYKLPPLLVNNSHYSFQGIKELVYKHFPHCLHHEMKVIS